MAGYSTKLVSGDWSSVLCSVTDSLSNLGPVISSLCAADHNMGAQPCLAVRRGWEDKCMTP